MFTGIKESNQGKNKQNTFLFLVLFFAIWVVRVIIYKYIDLNIESKLLAAALSLFWKTLVWIGLPFFYLNKVEKKDPLEYFKLSIFNKRTAYWCLIIILIGAGWQITLFLYKPDVHFPDLQGIALAIWSAGVCEEILFRGFLLRKFSEFMSFIPAMTFTSLLFVAAHIPGWLIFMDYSWQEVILNGGYVFGISIILSLIMKESGSLYPSIIFHSIADIISL
jgi:membrane protease YdiL (CAAX protease family)